MTTEVYSRRRVLPGLGLAALAASGLVVPSSGVVTPLPKEVMSFGFLRGSMIRDFVDLDSWDIATKHLNRLGYFGIELGREGKLARSGDLSSLSNSKVKEVLKKADSRRIRKVLTVRQFDPAVISFLLEKDNAELRVNASAEMVQTMRDQGFAGLCIDFEGLIDPGPLKRRRLTQWMSDLSHQMKARVKGAELSFCANPQEARASFIADVADLSEVTDYIIMMGYDYYSPKSGVINPVAPLYGAKAGAYWMDVSTNVDEFLELMPAEKLVLALPLYGMSGRVGNPAMGARLLSPAWTPTYVQAREFMEKRGENPEFQIVWSPQARLDWYADRNADGSWEMMVVGGPKTYAERYNFIKERKLKGAAFWTLDHITYGKSDPLFWQALRQNLLQ